MAASPEEADRGPPGAHLNSWTFQSPAFSMLDGITNGAVYALLGLATVLVFAVTRVIFIPQGEFVAYGALTLAIFQTGQVPGTVWLLLMMAVLAACSMLRQRGCTRASAQRA
jgi:branched-chain amino acid transport system permease protein